MCEINFYFLIQLFMNKKHLKIALLSLMCTSMALSYTACKDYDDDIDNLQQQINTNKDAIASINNQIANGAILTSVTKTADGKGIVVTVKKGDKTEEYTITNGENGKDADVWTIGTDGYWYKNDQKTDYRAIGSDGVQGPQGPQGNPGAPGQPGTPGTDGINPPYYKPNPTTGMFEYMVYDEAKKDYVHDSKGDIKYAEPSGATQSKLTVVDDGMNVIIKGAEGTTDDIVIAKSGALRGLVFIPDLYLDGVEGTRYAFAPAAPILVGNNANNTGKSYGSNQNFTIKDFAGFAQTTATPKTVDIPSISTINYELNPSNANVTDLNFSMFGAQKEAISRAAAPTFEVQGQPVRTTAGNLTVDYKIVNPANISTQKELLTVFATEAAVKDGQKESVTSDYATLVPTMVAFKALAFNADCSYYTDATDKRDLYTTGKKALESVPSVPIVWNQGALNLKEKLCIHYLAKDFELPTAGTHQVMTLADAESVYGLTTVFTKVKYNIGGNATDEDQYATVSTDGVFEPSYVDAQGNTVVNNGENGKSSIGRRPMVLVTLVNTQGQVILNGYVVFEITQKPELLKGDTIEPGSINSEECPYLCDFTVTSSWEQWSGKVLEYKGEDNAIMMSNEEFHAKFKKTPVKTFVKTAPKTYVEVANNKFGNITVQDDKFTGEVNSVLVWKGDLSAVKNIYAEADHTVTLYIQYKTDTDPATYVYVGMTVTIKNNAHVDWSSLDGTKYVPEWHDGQIWIHVAAPEAGNDVTTFEYFLPNAWLNGVIAPKATETVYNTNVKTSFRWSATQEAGYSVNGDSLMYKGAAIATLSADGKVVYQNNATAKALLNEIESPAGTPNRMVPTGNVEIAATYDDCNIAFPEVYSFTVKFLRPLTLKPGQNPKFTPATAGGSRAALASLFNLVDWRLKDVVTYDAATMTMSAVLDNNINLYTFYKVKQIIVDKHAITFNNGGKWEPITANKNDNLDIVADGDDTSFLTESGSTVTIDVTDIANLNKVEFVYTSNAQGVTSQYDLKIPVTLVYSWGNLSQEMPATVNVTMGN